MSENLITCKGANRFSLSELVREPGQEPGEHLRTTQLGLYNTSLYSSGKDAKPSKSFTHRQTMNPLIWNTPYAHSFTESSNFGEVGSARWRAKGYKCS
jgi:hypothetical protein